jgi:hypothetical protein
MEIDFVKIKQVANDGRAIMTIICRGNPNAKDIRKNHPTPMKL